MQEIIILTKHISFTDAIDILIVSLFLYGFLQIIKGRRAYYLLVGLIVFLIISFFLFLISNMFHLNTLKLVLSKFGIIFTFIFVIIFQSEIRQIFIYLGKVGGLIKSYEYKEETIDEVLTALEDMSKRKIGALILLQRFIEVKNILDYGVEIDAKVNHLLLKAIFITSSPLHDGAVIIHNDRIKYAGVILSLSEQTAQLKRHGTRHRAAISATEDSDVIALVVSEETGEISAAYNGNLIKFKNTEELKEFIKREHQYIQKENLKEINEKI